jgi:hypothetical protein
MALEGCFISYYLANLQQDSMTSPYLRLLQDFKASALSMGNCFFEFCLRYMPRGFCQQQFPGPFHGGVYFGKQPFLIRYLVNQGKEKREIDFTGDITQRKRVLISYPRIDSPGQSRLLGSPYETFDHFFLQIDTDNFARRAYKLGERQRKKSHAAADIQDTHPFSYVCPHDGLGILQKTPQRTRQ